MIADKEAISIKLSFESSKQEVVDFLEEMQSLISLDTFRLIKSDKEDEDILYSTPYTLLTLKYNDSDIIEQVKSLTIQNYSETLFDKDDVNPLHLFVFGKVIEGRTVYIKLKVKNVLNQYVLCVSFHFAKFPMKYPYA